MTPAAPPTETWILMPWLNSPEMTLQAVEDCLAQTVPTRVLLIDQGASQEDRQVVDRWIDQRAVATCPAEVGLAQAHPRVLCWHYLPALPSLSAVWNRALKFVWELGGEEALVVNNDLRLHRQTVEVLHRTRISTSALFVSCVGVREGQYHPTVKSDPRGGDGRRLADQPEPERWARLLVFPPYQGRT